MATLMAIDVNGNVHVCEFNCVVRDVAVGVKHAMGRYYDPDYPEDASRRIVTYHIQAGKTIVGEEVESMDGLRREYGSNLTDLELMCIYNGFARVTVNGEQIFPLAENIMSSSGQAE